MTVLWHNREGAMSRGKERFRYSWTKAPVTNGKRETEREWFCGTCKLRMCGPGRNAGRVVKGFRCGYPVGTSRRCELRIVKEGTSAVLLQSGLDENWWADSMECYAYLRNIQDLLSDGKTPYERRFGEPFKGPIIPFGSLVEYYPISAKDQSRIHQFGKTVLPGLFLGYTLYAGGVEFGRVT